MATCRSVGGGSVSSVVRWYEGRNNEGRCQVRTYVVLEDDIDLIDVPDVEAETGRQVALAECNYFTGVVLGYGTAPAD